MGITEALMTLWLVSALFVVFTRKVYRIIIFFAVFSLFSSVSFLFLGSPDVAMAEATISAFTTIFFIVCIEKYYIHGKGFDKEQNEEKNKAPLYKEIAPLILPLIFSVGLLGLFLYFMPYSNVATYLKNQYLQMFMEDVGGKNAITAIYLGYRVYDTLFEALLLVASVVAVSHLSWSSDIEVTDEAPSGMENSSMAKFTLRIICPIIIMFGAYLMANGHISAGGGFQGGLAVTTFFICRYMVYHIYDIPVKKVMRMEEVVFISMTILPVAAIFMGATYMTNFFVLQSNHLYLVAMNILIGFKVACGFFILFYRFVTIESR